MNRLLARSTITTVIFFICLILTQVYVLPTIPVDFEHGKTHYLFGSLIILALLLEPIAFFIKARYQEELDSGDGSFFLFAWVFHAALSTITLMMALSMFGHSIEESNLAAFLMPVNVIKELALLFIMLGIAKKKEVKTNTEGWSMYLADIISIFSFLAYYGTFWHSMTFVKVETGSIGYMIFQAIPAAILFLIFYVPARIPSLIEDAVKLRNDAYFTQFAISILITTALAIWPLFT